MSDLQPKNIELYFASKIENSFTSMNVTWYKHKIFLKSRRKNGGFQSIQCFLEVFKLVLYFFPCRRLDINRRIYMEKAGSEESRFTIFIGNSN